ncbi:VOC family protein [Paenibacillus sp. BC26]|uniref:VOC family protein n=1 Tax=Paenibacillus sp. BC26 TaxID=1881032 RepID=UPI001160E143|nr:VOC family protein [Paenibacillus sp. BC26]
MESICFEVDRINELYRQMKDSGAKVSELKENGGCGGAFHFFDPDGNKYTAWQGV